MADEKKDKSYGIEPDEEREAAPPSPADVPESLPPEPDSIRALDVCPNCGSPLGGVDVVVCLRCGYDMKAMKVIKTDTKGTAAEPQEQDSGVLVEAGLGDLWLPAAMAVAGLGLLGAGYLWRSWSSSARAWWAFSRCSSGRRCSRRPASAVWLRWPTSCTSGSAT